MAFVCQEIKVLLTYLLTYCQEVQGTECVKCSDNHAKSC